VTGILSSMVSKWINGIKTSEIQKPFLSIVCHNMGTHYDEAIQYSLVCFCDASAKVYSAAIYLWQSLSDSCKTDLIFCKPRLAPQNTTIPRLELLGVLIGVRVLKFVMKELHVQVTHTFVFSDSLCVFHWLSTKKPPVICEGEENKLRCFWDIESLSIIDEPSSEESMEGFPAQITFDLLQHRYKVGSWANPVTPSMDFVWDVSTSWRHAYRRNHQCSKNMMIHLRPS